MMKWVLQTFISGIFPSERHDGIPFSASPFAGDSARNDRAGRALNARAAVVRGITCMATAGGKTVKRLNCTLRKWLGLFMKQLERHACAVHVLLLLCVVFWLKRLSRTAPR